MAASKKGAFTIGLLMAISFAVVLFVMFSEIFPGPAGKKVNGLDWADDLFNKLAKGSSYFIPKLKETNQKFMGRPFTATIKDPECRGGGSDQQALHPGRRPGERPGRGADH